MRLVAKWIRGRAWAHISRAFQLIIGFPLFVLGLAGIPDDLKTWQHWIDRMTRDERVLALAERATNAADWLNQPVVRIVLVLIGVALLLWRIPWFWRLRHKIAFKGRLILSDKVWINQGQALALLQNSEWGQLKRPRLGGVSFDIVGMTGGESQHSKRQRKFQLYLKKSLDNFEADNPEFVQKSENGKRYEQGALQKFVEYALNAELFDDFGTLPHGIVGDT